MPVSRTRLRRPRALAALCGGVAVTVVAVFAGCAMLGPGLLGGGTVDTVGAVDFRAPLAIPPLAESTVDADGTRVFALDARSGKSAFAPGVDTPTWGFNGTYLGPTLRAERGESVRVDVSNSLEVPTTVHWHGMHLPAVMDGGPHQMVDPGSTWSPEWTVDQPAATLWYHPHPHGETEEHVRMGLAGLFILTDEAESALPLPREYGVDDVPVVVQDIRLNEAGELRGDNMGFVGALGDRLLVNGTSGPVFDVTTDLVRLRLLNASTARTYDFTFDDARSFDLVATDGGLLERPLPTESIQLSPGERAEIVVRMDAGETAVLRSEPPDLGIGDGIAARNGGADRFDVLQLRAAETLASVATVPAELTTIDRLDPASATATRELELNGFTINDRSMDMHRIDEVVTVGDTEVWNVVNTMGMPHNFHIHDVQFQVASIDGAPPPPELGGWKDTVYLPPQETFRLVMRFEDYTDAEHPYMYHCHLLWHEDQGMMGQFVVVEPGEHVTMNRGDHHDH
jgi:suppressor of ftsI